MAEYRPDIDGLRAVAVIPVVLYHAGFETFGGGFVGVDVFFVISGFLITSIIAREITEGRFSILKFYERRIRRLFPALFAVLLFCTVMSSWLFMPAEFLDFGRSVAATALFVSNILFWTESGYFAGSGTMKPLLHTWSLAVEEQFYVFFPLFMLLTYWLRRGSWAAWIIVGMLSSFALSVWGARFSPDATFFLAPTRAWELLLGCLIALNTVPRIERAWLREGTAALGIMLIATSILWYTDETRFPGISALLPCLGAAAIIHAGGNGSTIAGRVLSLRPLVFIGLISYSVYLWHWPLLVYANYYAIEPLGLLLAWAVVGLSLLAGAGSWLWIERPFRSAENLGIERRPLFVGATAATAVAAAFGLLVHVNDGISGRVPAEAVAYASASGGSPDRHCRWIDLAEIRAGNVCTLGPEEADAKFIVWGDSHAESLLPALEHLADRFAVTGQLATAGGCPPLLERIEDPPCANFNAAMRDLIKASDARTVILAGRWAEYEDDLARYLPRTLRFLAAQGVRVRLVEQVPELANNGPSSLGRAVHFGRSIAALATPLKEHLHHQLKVREAFGHAQLRFDFTRVDPARAFCPQDTCSLALGGRSLYRDSNHLSRTGALLLIDELAPIFRELRDRPSASGTN